MAIVFPASPSNNDTFTVGSITYTYDGSKWIGLGVTPTDRLIEGNNNLQINASNNLVWTGNNVLLGTTDAGSNGTADDLVVVNNGSANDQAGITIRGGTSGRSQIFFSDGTSGEDEYRGMVRYDHQDNSMQFRTNAAEVFHINSTGKVRVGAGSASYNLEISGSGAQELMIGSSNASLAGIILDGDSNGDGAGGDYAQIFHNTDGTLNFRSRNGSGGTATIFYSNTLETLRIQPSGFVGINEDSPGAQLTVKRASTSSTGLLGGLKLKQGSATNGNRISLLFSSLDDFDVAAVNGVIETHSGSTLNNEGRLEFWTKHGGSDIAVRGKFDSEGSFFNFSVNHGIYTETSIGAGTVKYLYRAANSNGSNIVFNVWSNGNVESATNSFGPVSDVKLKENIVDANSQWEDFKAVQFRKFNFKEESGYETHTQLGVIAQELEAISPGLVYETPDLDRDGNDTGTTTKKVKASVLTMKALVALQEAMEKIEVLEKRLSNAGM